MIHKIENTKKYNQNFMAGFTLIELLVATSIFLMTITVGITSLLMMHRTHHITQYKKEQLDALHAVMEDMVRNIRVGTKIRCDITGAYSGTVLDPFTGATEIRTPLSCFNNYTTDQPQSNSIAFEGIDGDPLDDLDQISYYIEYDAILDKRVIYKAHDVDFYNDFTKSIRVSPDSVDIDFDKSGFTVIHAEDSDLKQPLVLIRLVGTVTYQNDSTPFSLQTAVMQRNPKL